MQRDTTLPTLEAAPNLSLPRTESFCESLQQQHRQGLVQRLLVPELLLPLQGLLTLLALQPLGCCHWCFRQTLLRVVL
jgi:hypothetical protein